MKKILLISYGDPYSAKTWSNMPFYLIKAFENEKCNVDTLDLFPYHSLLSKIYSVRRRILSKIKKKDLYITYDRSIVFSYFANRKMKKKLSKTEYDICITMTYSFNPKKYTNAFSIMIGDFTTEYAIRMISNRDIDSCENRIIQYQEQCLENSDLNVTIFKEVEDFYSSRNITMEYLGNVVNLPTLPLDKDSIKVKYDSDEITFIGKEKYIDALTSLMKALAIVNKDLKLNVIGIKKFNSSYHNTTFYGYLDKTDTTELDKYVEIVKRSKCVINTNDIFAGFTALGEAMYFGTPVITSNTPTFHNIFGDKEVFGYYSSNEPTEIAKKIEELLDLDYEEYNRLALNCRKLVEKFTWSSYVKFILAVIEDRRNEK